MNKMIKFFKEGVNSYVENIGHHQLFRVTGDCTPSHDYEKLNHTSDAPSIRKVPILSFIQLKLYSYETGFKKSVIMVFRDSGRNVQISASHK